MSKQARILIVDDEKALRDIVSRALAKLGHECVTAANGEEALAIVSEAFDLVIDDQHTRPFLIAHSGVPLSFASFLGASRTSRTFCMRELAVNGF